MKNRNKLLGIEIGGTKLQLALSTLNGKALQQFRYTISPEEGAAGIKHQILECLKQIGADTIAAIGVGFGGPINRQTGVIQTSHQVDGWSGFNLKEWLQSHTESPVLLDNDANVAALGEALHGSGKHFSPVFYMTLGSGIGGGLVVHNQLYHGALPGEVEIGHIRLTKAGNTLESECSGWAINKKIRQSIEAHPNGYMATLSKNLTAPEATLLLPALEKEDNSAITILEDLADNIAFALSHVVHLFHPQRIIIGGGLSLIGEPLRGRIAKKLPRYVMAAFLPISEIVIASLGEAVVPIGALELAKQAHQASMKTNSL